MIRLLNTLIALCLMVVVTAVQAVPITLSGQYLFREGRSFQSGTAPSGGFLLAPDIIQVGAIPNPISGTTGRVSTSITVETFPLISACGGPAASPVEGLCNEFEYTSDRANGSWQITATNGLDIATTNLGSLGNPAVPPFATDVVVGVLADGGLNVSWRLPSGTGAANQIRLRIHDTSGARVFQQTLPVSATSATVQAGVLTQDGTYWARVMLEQTGLSSFEFLRRASTFEEFQFSAPMSVRPSVFFGEDLNGDPTARLPATPNATAANAAFLRNLVGAGTENFENFAAGTLLPLAVSFPGAGIATISGSTTAVVSSIPSGTDGSGRYPLSGDQLVKSVGYNPGAVPVSVLTIGFDSPVAAFGFFGIDVGDVDQLIVDLSLTGGGLVTLTVPHTVSLRSPFLADGAVFFFGFIFADGTTVDSMNFRKQGIANDNWGFDDMTIGALDQVSMVPEPATIILPILQLLLEK